VNVVGGTQGHEHEQESKEASTESHDASGTLPEQQHLNVE